MSEDAQTAAAPDAAAAQGTWPPRRRGRKRTLFTAAAAAAVVAAAGVAERSAVAGSVAVLGHLRWAWMPAVIMLESSSMVAFARMHRRLLAAGRARFGLVPMLATVYAANAVSVSVPLAGPELAAAFTFRRFTRQGADAPLAGWSLLVGGVVSTAAGALVVAGGGLASGNVLAAAVAVPGGVLAAAVLVGVAVAARRPGLRGALERPAVWALRRGSWLARRPVADPGQVVRIWAGRLGELQLSLAGWTMVIVLAVGNWLAGAGVLAVGILAVGAAVPWHDLLLAYGAGIAAQSFSVTPGGLGVTEGTLGLALAAAGMRASRALAAVLIYRLVSFWLVALAGWLILIWLRHPWRHAGAQKHDTAMTGPVSVGHARRPARRRRPPAAPPNFVDISERAVVTPAGQAGAHPPAGAPDPLNRVTAAHPAGRQPGPKPAHQRLRRRSSCQLRHRTPRLPPQKEAPRPSRPPRRPRGGWAWCWPSSRRPSS